MPRGIPTSKKPKPTLVEELCTKIGCDINNDIFNPKNGTITKELLQEVCKYLNLDNQLSKKESANLICTHLKLSCTTIDFNPTDGTISAGFIEKTIKNINK